MGKVIKATRELESRLKELYSLGYTYSEIGRFIGMTKDGFAMWLKRNPAVRAGMHEIRAERLKGVIERGLQALAEGVRIEEIHESWTEEDSEGRRVKKTRVIKELPPNVKAIEVLARKYDTIFSRSELSQINNLIQVESPLSMRELLEYKSSKDNPINNFVEAEVIDVTPKEEIEDTPSS